MIKRLALFITITFIGTTAFASEQKNEGPKAPEVTDSASQAIQEGEELKKKILARKAEQEKNNNPKKYKDKANE